MEDYTFTGCIMLGFAPVSSRYNWFNVLKNTDVNWNQVLNYEYEPHVTLLYGIHRDDIQFKSFKESISNIFIPTDSDMAKQPGIQIPPQIEIDNRVSYFESPDRKVMKFNIPKDSLSFLKLSILRQRLRLNFRYQLTHPNYHAHVTALYLEPSFKNKICYFNKENKLNDSFMLDVQNLILSYRDDNGNLINDIIPL